MSSEWKGVSSRYFRVPWELHRYYRRDPSGTRIVVPEEVVVRDRDRWRLPGSTGAFYGYYLETVPW